MWISYLEFSRLSSSSESAFRNEIKKVFDNCRDLGINTVYIHARSHSDAYYSSDLFPRTKYLGGNYDPLKIVIEEAHARKLSVQAWINPLRGCAVSDIERQKGYQLYDWRDSGKQLVKVGTYYYLNPAYSEVIKLIADGVTEIVKNYDVDGLHIDDYFYPTTDTSFDKEAFSKSGKSSLSQFRLENCDNFVKAIYNAVKSADKRLIFSVSTQGNIQNNYDYMYADIKKWCREDGYLDVVMPQIYFGFNNSSQPFVKCSAEWNEIALSGKKPLVIGLSVSKLGAEDTWAGAGKTEWMTDKKILMRQFLQAVELPSYGGICLYSYDSIFNPPASAKAQTAEEIEALKAVMN